MTRINLVPVKALADQHLAAERREIKMVPAALRRSLKTRRIDDILINISTRYILNTGHVKFFYPRMKFLTERYKLLTNELLIRRFNLSDPSDDFTQYTYDIPDKFNQIDWYPDKKEIDVNVERISVRISEKPDWYRYYGKRVEEGYFDNMYNSL